ncbi:MAG TPA: hypothetical protein DD490_29980 [Acidobacteria bacterium]|nr:hypothetical protein [Acidobacteriota bacterium]
MLAGDVRTARARYQAALEIAPDFSFAEVRLLRLDFQESGRGGDVGLLRRSRELARAARQNRAAGDEWPDSALDEALLETGLGHSEEALRALDAAIALGHRDAAWLLLDPMLAPLRDDPATRTGFGRRIATIRRLVDAERQRVEGAPWLPPSFLTGSAARM